MSGLYDTSASRVPQHSQTLLVTDATVGREQQLEPACSAAFKSVAGWAGGFPYAPRCLRRDVSRLLPSSSRHRRRRLYLGRRRTPAPRHEECERRKLHGLAVLIQRADTDNDQVKVRQRVPHLMRTPSTKFGGVEKVD